MVAQTHQLESVPEAFRHLVPDHGKSPWHPSVKATKRVLNLHVERAVLASIDFALAAETESFDTDDLRANVARFLKRSSG